MSFSDSLTLSGFGGGSENKIIVYLCDWQLRGHAGML